MPLFHPTGPFSPLLGPYRGAMVPSVTNAPSGPSLSILGGSSFLELPLDQPPSTTALTGATDRVSRVIFLPEEKLVAAASHDSVVRVYNTDTAGKPRAEFKKHTGKVRGVARLGDDLVASVGGDRLLYSWRPSNLELLRGCGFDEPLPFVLKLDDGKIVDGDGNGRLFVLTHSMGTKFQISHEEVCSGLHCVIEMVMNHEFIVACSTDKKANVWAIKSSTFL